ncbi:hypothetical protein [Pararhizobium sp. PWRC1-1]|uniref:hypothetical protein n=1 Tax=Pararhizobium sp. PWRC1-1 TaxID=2804566 RepID=UPI003CEC298F
MSKAGLDLKGFSIASRRAEAKPDVTCDTKAVAASAPTHKTVAPLLPKPSEKQRREMVEARAIAQEDVRYSLKNLKRTKQRNVKFFINIALDYDLKARLQKAALENDLKMTAVVKAALDYYLMENGY